MFAHLFMSLMKKNQQTIDRNTFFLENIKH